LSGRGRSEYPIGSERGKYGVGVSLGRGL